VRSIPENIAFLTSSILVSRTRRRTYTYNECQQLFPRRAIQFYKTEKSRNSRRFEHHLIDHDIYPAGCDDPDDCQTPEPENSDGLPQHRPPLSLPCFATLDFRNFKQKNAQPKDKDNVIIDVLILSGKIDQPVARKPSLKPLNRSKIVL